MNIFNTTIITLLLSVTPLWAQAQSRNVHSFTMTDIDGKQVNLADYKAFQARRIARCIRIGMLY